MRTRARIERLEAKSHPGHLDDIPLEVLKRFDFLSSKWFAVGHLDALEGKELLGISVRYGIIPGTSTLEQWAELIETELNDPELSQEQQIHINEFARNDPAYRPFATQKTWCNDFDSPRLASHWWVAVEQSSLPTAVQARAADLLRRRVRKIQLLPEEITWLAEALQDLDLGPEQPWLRDHLGGEAAVSSIEAAP